MRNCVLQKSFDVRVARGFLRQPARSRGLAQRGRVRLDEDVDKVRYRDEAYILAQVGGPQRR